MSGCSCMGGWSCGGTIGHVIMACSFFMPLHPENGRHNINVNVKYIRYIPISSVRFLNTLTKVKLEHYSPVELPVILSIVWNGRLRFAKTYRFDTGGINPLFNHVFLHRLRATLSQRHIEIRTTEITGMPFKDIGILWRFLHFRNNSVRFKLSFRT